MWPSETPTTASSKPWFKNPACPSKTNWALSTTFSCKTAFRLRLTCLRQSPSRKKTPPSESSTTIFKPTSTSSATRKAGTRQPDVLWCSTTTTQLLLGAWCSWRSRTSWMNLTASSTTQKRWLQSTRLTRNSGLRSKGSKTRRHLSERSPASRTWRLIKTELWRLTQSICWLSPFSTTSSTQSCCSPDSHSWKTILRAFRM